MELVDRDPPPTVSGGPTALTQVEPIGVRASDETAAGNPRVDADGIVDQLAGF